LQSLDDSDCTGLLSIRRWTQTVGRFLPAEQPTSRTRRSALWRTARTKTTRVVSSHNHNNNRDRKKRIAPPATILKFRPTSVHLPGQSLSERSVHEQWHEQLQSVVDRFQRKSSFEALRMFGTGGRKLIRVVNASAHKVQQ
jgi:hypothetical protein